MELSGCLVWWVGAVLSLVHPAVPPPTVGAVPAVPVATVLDRWAAARAAAWSAGDVTALRGLYTPGSPAGRADARLLRRYLDRGLRVAGLQTQLFSVRVLTSRHDRLVVRVVERVTGAVAVDGVRCAELPRDRPVARTVSLRRVGDRWRVATIR
jgi:hypothetical protein